MRRLGALRCFCKLSRRITKEFEKLKPENTVYKLVGPGLVQQDQEEAKANVSKRLEFINAEM